LEGRGAVGEGSSRVGDGGARAVVHGERKIGARGTVHGEEERELTPPAKGKKGARPPLLAHGKCAIMC